jgi:hypothetical protein
MKKANLYLAILIPIGMIVITTFTLLWHQKALHPENNFLYLASESFEAFYCLEQIKFELLPNQPKPKNAQQNCSKIQFYVYDFKTRTSTPMTREEVARLPLSLTIADGYKIENYSSSGSDLIWPLLGATYYPDLSLLKGNYEKRLNVQDGTQLKNYYSLQFIAWIKNTTSHP